MIFTVLLIVAAVLEVLCMILKNQMLGDIALLCVIAALLLGHV